MPRTEASRLHRFQVARAAPSGRAPGTRTPKASSTAPARPRSAPSLAPHSAPGNPDLVTARPGQCPMAGRFGHGAEPATIPQIRSRLPRPRERVPACVARTRHNHHMKAQYRDVEADQRPRTHRQRPHVRIVPGAWLKQAVLRGSEVAKPARLVRAVPPAERPRSHAARDVRPRRGCDGRPESSASGISSGVGSSAWDQSSKTRTRE
jgi:hypothetical protein